MCGIVGRLNFESNEPTDASLIHRMNDVLSHRGPDDDGVWTNGPVGLGQRRLAIIDLSPSGHQPMSNEDGSIWITFNGEIYNHLSLRTELEKQGHRYRGSSDTETILHLYEEMGVDAISQLRGMFSIALWDEREQRLLLARDRFGQKPLVYAEAGNGLTFGSEIKAVLQDTRVEREVNEGAIHKYLTRGYVPTPQTAFQQIRKLPPASILICQRGQITIECYWKLAFEPKLQLDETEAAEELLRQLDEATKIRLMSDVPLGAFLSGGVDSSGIVALMAQQMSEPVKTFSIGFEEQSFNETGYAQQVADLYGTDHHEFIVQPDALSVLPELVWAYGEPFADSSALPTYYVAQMTSRHVTVALNGDGGDEAFAGYERYVAHNLGGQYAQIPKWIRDGLLTPIASALPEPTSRKNLVRRVKNFVLTQNLPPHQRYARWLTLVGDETKEQIYTADFADRMTRGPSNNSLDLASDGTSQLHMLDRVLSSDVETYLPDDLLVKVDIATMIHSLEGRSPFLDHELAEFAAALPADYKLRGRNGKHILKVALERHLPHSILYRQKSGFAVPIGRWFRQELRQMIYDLLLDPVTLQRGFFTENGLRILLDEHANGRVDHRQRLWALMMLELWFRAYIDRPRSELTSAAVGIFA